jgi:hypothetical protein
MICVGLLALHLATLQHRSDMLALQQQYPATETHRAPALLGLSRSSSTCGATIKVRVLIQIAALYPRLTCRKGIRLPFVGTTACAACRRPCLPKTLALCKTV